MKQENILGWSTLDLTHDMRLDQFSAPDCIKIRAYIYLKANSEFFIEHDKLKNSFEETCVRKVERFMKEYDAKMDRYFRAMGLWESIVFILFKRFKNETTP
jgi:hypothetical protein